MVHDLFWEPLNLYVIDVLELFIIYTCSLSSKNSILNTYIGLSSLYEDYF
jgi:hypothetical protein